MSSLCVCCLQQLPVIHSQLAPLDAVARQRDTAHHTRGCWVLAASCRLPRRPLTLHTLTSVMSLSATRTARITVCADSEIFTSSVTQLRSVCCHGHGRDTYCRQVQGKGSRRLAQCGRRQPTLAVGPLCIARRSCTSFHHHEGEREQCLTWFQAGCSCRRRVCVPLHVGVCFCHRRPQRRSGIRLWRTRFCTKDSRMSLGKPRMIFKA